jgi:hypothetical protein
MMVLRKQIETLYQKFQEKELISVCATCNFQSRIESRKIIE